MSLITYKIMQFSIDYRKIGIPLIYIDRPICPQFMHCKMHFDEFIYILMNLSQMQLTKTHSSDCFFLDQNERQIQNKIAHYFFLANDS